MTTTETANTSNKPATLANQPKVLAQKIDSIKCWTFANKALTYFGPIIPGNSEIKWRAAYDHSKVFAKLEEIASGDKENKDALMLQALKSMTQPSVPPFQVQLGGLLEEVKTEVTPEGKEVQVVVPNKVNKFPKAKGDGK